MEIFLNPDAWISLLTLTFLEIVLGIDNIIFISIIANKLPESLRTKATNIGLLFAMVQRILLLSLVSYLVGLRTAFYFFKTNWFSIALNWQSIILFAGGIFLIYKSVSEIYQKSEHKNKSHKINVKASINSYGNAIAQILLIDFIFSIDSILTAVGMVNGISDSHIHSLIIMSLAVVISILIMMLFANPIRRFIDQHPSIQILALAFLILIGFLLITEAAHSSGIMFFGNSINPIPKGYLYFAILFALLIEFINIKVNKSK